MRSVLKIGILFFGLLLQVTLSFSQKEEMEKVKQHIKASYLEVLNGDKRLRQSLSEILKHSDNPDIMIRELKETVDTAQVKKWLDTIEADGHWPDVNYQDESRSGWSPSLHAERLKMMARAYKDKNSIFFQHPDLQRALHAGMAYWFQGNFKCRNWWYNQIGVPKMLGAVFLLMEEEMDTQEKKAAIRYMENARFGMTGQNRVWLAENVLVRSLLQGDEKLFLAAREAILQELKINENGEGIRPDNSFQQHGCQLQFGNYGLAFANTMAYWAKIWKGTRYALTEEQLKILRQYFLQGMQWIVWKRNMDISSCGRQLFRHSQEGKALSFGKALQHMQAADPAFAKEYKQFYRAHVLVNGKKNKWTGMRYFPYSDFGVVRRKHWYATIKMSSKRVIGTETTNNENISGKYLGDGALFFYRDGREYKDIFPVWDWTKIPGTTAYADTGLLYDKRATAQNRALFAGGISDGINGAAALMIDKNGLKARKSYFFMPEGVVCMGSGIAAEKEPEVTTCVAQSLKRGMPAMLPDRKAFYQDGIVYVGLENTQMEMTCGEQTGSWRNVAHFYDTACVKNEVFRLWIKQGVRPQNAGYCYAVWPGIKESQWERKATARAVRVVRCDDKAHILGWGKKDKRWMAVFFEPAQIKLSQDMEISVKQGCLMMLQQIKKGYRLSICEPTQRLKTVTLHFSKRFEGNKGKWKYGEAGSCLTVETSGRGETQVIELKER